MTTTVTKVTEKNCNGLLTRCYKRRDSLGEAIDRSIVAGQNTVELEQLYREVCKEIEELCEFRRNHDCLLEGDPGFSFT